MALWDVFIRIMRVPGPMKAAILAMLLLPTVSVSAGPEPMSHVDLDFTRSKSCDCRVVWVALEDAKQIVKVDVDRGKVIARHDVAGPPHNLTISPSGDVITTALWSSARIVVRRDGKTRTVVLGGSPHDVKVDGGRIVVANQTEARLDVLTSKGKFIRSIGLKADPHDLALRWRGRQAWATLEGTDDIAVVNVRSSKVRYVSTGRSPHDILFAPDGKLWVTDWNGAIHVFSKKGRMLKTIPLGVEAHHLDFTPDGRQVWITDHAVHRVFVLSTKNYSIRKRFHVEGAPHHVGITSDGDRALVADHDRGTLIVYNVNKLRRAATITIGAGPHGVWAMP